MPALESPPEPAKPPVPELPDNATPEQIDQHWLKHTYQGDHQRQFTFRAVCMGGLLGMLMALSNLYTTLKLGWSFGVAVTACVLSYVLWNGVRVLSGNRLSQMSLLENNCMQSTASAAGYSTGGTVGSAFGALLLVTGEHQPWYVLTPMVLLTAALGVFVAIPMKRQMINYEQLKFPSGIAAAETLRSLYAHGVEAARKAYSLLGSFAIGGVIGILRHAGELADDLRVGGHPQVWMEKILSIFGIPDLIEFPKRISQSNGIKLAGMGFEPSVLLIGAGMLVGLRISLSMLASSALLYFIIVPKLLALDAAHADLHGYVASLAIKGGITNPARWALWGGTSIMLFSSLTSVALQWRTLARAFVLRRNGSEEKSDAIGAVEVPMSWLFIGLVPITIGLVLVQWLAFHINALLGLLAVLMSFVVALVCCRATGETDTTPIGAMGKLTQLLYSTLPGSAGSPVINLVTGGMTSAAGASAADLLTDLKSGYLLGANARKQFLAQFVGVFFGTLAIVPAWYLIVPSKAVLESFNPPAANMWRAVAELLTKGWGALPQTAISAIVVGAIFGVILPLLERFFPRAQRFLPSAMGLGLGLVIPFQNSLSFALGAVLVFIWTKINSRGAETYNVSVASGFVAGESLTSAILTILRTALSLMIGK